ncbi:MAG: PadR family transcriptional regulator [OCS116 cluster bacterium]|uniref:PadR family transcriptional regulator n=1 Tax=OCS116 cluster bacterium TaxID=2030921 RepID=A0A2A4YQ70_9PROT|nr:PadR family transcriptional regulator [OCS116 cluster bacterium]
MQDMIILGLLQFTPMSSYDIKKKIERSTSNFYNASMGSIHPALKKLTTKRAVTIEEKIDNGRLKRIYTISPLGIEMFNQWLDDGIGVKNSKDPALAKLFFMGFTDKSAQVMHLKNHIIALNQKYIHLKLLQDEFAGVTAPEGLEDHLIYQMATLDYGVEGVKFSRDWYKKLLAKIDNQ